MCAAAAEATGIPVGTPVVVRGHRWLRRPARRRGPERGQLELRAGHHPGAQGRHPRADPRPAGRRLLPQGAQRRLAARRGLQHRRGRGLPGLPRRRPRRAQPAGRPPRAGRRAGLPAGVGGRTVPVRRTAARGFLLGAPGRRRRPLRRGAAGSRVRRAALLRLPRPARRTPGRRPHPDRRRDEERLLVPAARRHPRPPGHPARHRRRRARDGRAGRLTGPRGRRRRRRDGPHPRGHRTAARFARPIRRAVPAVRGRTRRPRLAAAHAANHARERTNR